MEFSDEEVLADSPSISDLDEDDDEAAEGFNGSPHKRVKSTHHATGVHLSDSEVSFHSEEDKDIDGWGSSKQDYYNADVIETEADALEEEAEARRLQKKQLQRLTEEDFGLDELEWAEGGEGEEDGKEGGRGKVVQEVLPELEITDAMGPEERLKIMRGRYPEFEPLAKEFVQLQAIHEDMRLEASAAIAVHHRLQAKAESGNLAKIYKNSLVTTTKFNAISSYLAALCIYFALLTSKAGGVNGKITAISPTELRRHTIMEALVQCRDLWSKAKDIPTLKTEELMNAGVEFLATDTTPEPKFDQKDEIVVNRAVNGAQEKKRKKPRLTKGQKAALAARAEEEARYLGHIENTERELLALSALTAPSQTSKPVQARDHIRSDSPLSDSSFGEQTTLHPNDAFEKAKSKKSLRFYTSQIVQKSQKRGAAGRHAGGDDDIPYRERLRDRQERLNAAAENRGNKKPNNNDVLDNGSENEAHQPAIKPYTEDTNNENADDDEAYYNFIATRSAQKKAKKKNPPSSSSFSSTAPLSTNPSPTQASDPKRGITYAISKNKGLAPRRRKEVRNPRVKKRKKFEEKMKKLGSVRQVWKGGEGRGGYAGEVTGIKKGLVRGVKL